MSVFKSLTIVNCTKVTCYNVSDGQSVAGVGELILSQVVLSAIIILGNSFNLLTIRQNYRLRTTLDMYLTSLATAGLLTGLCVLLISTINTSRYNLDETGSAYKYLCLSIVSLTAISSMATMSTLTLLTVDRCVSVTFPFYYKAKHTKRTALLAILGSWAGSSIYGVLNFWFNRFSTDVKCSFMTVVDIWYVRYLSSTLIIILIATNIFGCVQITCVYFRTNWPVFQNKRQIMSDVSLRLEPKTLKKMARYDRMTYSALPLCTFVETTATQIESTPRTFSYEIDKEIFGRMRNISKQKSIYCHLAKHDFKDTSCSLVERGYLCLEGKKVSNICENSHHLINPTQKKAFQEMTSMLQLSGLKFRNGFHSLYNLKNQQNYGLEEVLIPLYNPLSQRKSSTNQFDREQLLADTSDKKCYRSLPNLTLNDRLDKTGTQLIYQKQFQRTCSYHTTNMEKNKPKDKCKTNISASYCLQSVNLSLEETESAVSRNTELELSSHPRIMNRTFGSEKKLSAPSTKYSGDIFDETNIEPYFELNSKGSLYKHLNSHGISEIGNENNSALEQVDHGGAFINMSNSSKSSSPIAGPHRLREEPMVPKEILARAQSKTSCQIITMLLFFQTMYILFFLPCLIIFVTFGLMVIPEWLKSLALLLLCVSNVVFTVIYMVLSARYRAIYSSIAKRLQVTCDSDQDTIDVI